MTKQELSQALELAKSNTDLSNADDCILIGCALPDFKPVHCTLQQVARLIRWQVIMFNGGIDAEALNEMASIGRKKFIIVG